MSASPSPTVRRPPSAEPPSSCTRITDLRRTANRDSALRAQQPPGAGPRRPRPPVTTSGGRKRSVVGPGGVDHQALLEQRGARRRRRVGAHLGRDHQPAAAHGLDPPASSPQTPRPAARLSIAHVSPAAPGWTRMSQRPRWPLPRSPDRPANVEPWSPGSNTSDRRGPTTSAPIGRPPPSPFAHRRSHRHHAASARRPRASPCAPLAGLHLVEHERRADPGRTPPAPPAARPRRAGAPRSRPYGLEHTAAVPSCTAASIASAAGATATKPGTQRRQRRPLGLLRRGRQRAVRAPVESCPPPRTSSPPRLALRTSLIAASFASAPELPNSTVPPGAPGQALGQRDHRRGRRTGWNSWISRPICPRTAPTTAGWHWPVLQTPIPERKSRDSTPSASPSTCNRRPRRTRPGSARSWGRARSRRGPGLRPEARVGEQLRAAASAAPARRRCARSSRRRGSRPGRPGAWVACRRPRPPARPRPTSPAGSRDPADPSTG